MGIDGRISVVDTHESIHIFYAYIFWCVPAYIPVT